MELVVALFRRQPGEPVMGPGRISFRCRQSLLAFLQTRCRAGVIPFFHTPPSPSQSKCLSAKQASQVQPPGGADPTAKGRASKGIRLVSRPSRLCAETRPLGRPIPSMTSTTTVASTAPAPDRNRRAVTGLPGDHPHRFPLGWKKQPLAHPQSSVIRRDQNRRFWSMSFGEIGIDNDLIISTGGRHGGAGNGCICCSINGRAA